MVDASVLLSFFAVFAVACWAVGGQALARFDGDDRVGALLALIGTALILGMVGAFLGETWSAVIENIRVGNAHLSNRAFRIPWVRHRVVFSTLTFVVAGAVLTARVWLARRRAHVRLAR